MVIAVTVMAGCGEAVQVYTVLNYAFNTAGGARFNREIGTGHARQTLEAATSFIWSTFRQNSAAERRDPPRVVLRVEDFEGVARSSDSDNIIHLSARYIERFSGDVRREVEGILYHELVHLLQWYGGAPRGLIEGIADFVRLRAGRASYKWVGPGDGSPWDKGYDVTARFLEYLETLRPGFVADLNKRLRNGFRPSLFNELLGKDVDTLWAQYKRRYGREL